MILPEGLTSRGFVLPDESTWDVKIENDMKKSKEKSKEKVKINYKKY